MQNSFPDLSLYHWWRTTSAADDAVRVNARRIALALQRHTATRVALYCDDLAQFTAAFIGVLLARKTVVLLPNVQPAFVAAIKDQFDVLLCDRADVDAALSIVALCAHDGATASAFDVAALRQGTVDIFTSGTSGEPKCIHKSLAQLEAEINVLEAQWGGELDGATIVATVSHQHIYGLLFRVLWPLLAQRHVVADVFQYPEPLLDVLQQLPAAVLISSPAHLHRMPELVDLAALKAGNLRAVFSSGGRLEHRAALTFFHATGTAVTEVLGSTETGGVAWRRQVSEFDRSLWQPLPRVSVTTGADDVLIVRSPFLAMESSAESGDGFAMGDRARVCDDGRFELLDRIDQVVKVEGKRVALNEIARELRRSPLVDDAAAVLLQSHRDSIGAVVVLSEQGRAAHARDAKAVNAQLRTLLANYFEAVVLPKKWRFVDALPMNAQGKITQAALQVLFAKHPQPLLPEVLAQTADDNALTLQLQIPRDLFYFDGHFPERPLLPGVVQVDWAVHFAQPLMDAGCEFVGLEALKFQSFIVPEQRVELTLRWAPAKHKLTFAYASASGAHSSGRVAFAARDTGA